MKPKKPIDDMLRDALDARSDSLDAAARARLRQARTAALEQTRARSLPGRLTLHNWAMPAGALATLFGVAIGVSLWLGVDAPDPTLEQISGSPAMLVEFADADVDIDLLEEIEFYDWLSLIEANGDSA